LLSKKLISYLEDVLSEKIIRQQPLSGGDINQVYQLVTDTRKLVIKHNSSSKFPGMFEAEANGLHKLRETLTFTIPEVWHFGACDEDAFLVLQYIETGKRTIGFWEVFGEQLANLHQKTNPYFGAETDNYIGSLPQYNKVCSSASDFYITQRLAPQFALASQKGFSFSNMDTFYKIVERNIPEEPSSLVHGDLWNGNFMVDNKGFPCLIDPAAAYAPREMDIAMMQLFGGFNPKLFEVYHEIFPLEKNWEERIPLWQLYYLLVHLNLFGSSCYNSIINVLRKYS